MEISPGDDVPAPERDCAASLPMLVIQFITRRCESSTRRTPAAPGSGWCGGFLCPGCRDWRLICSVHPICSTSFLVLAGILPDDRVSCRSHRIRSRAVFPIDDFDGTGIWQGRGWCVLAGQRHIHIGHVREGLPVRRVIIAIKRTLGAPSNPVCCQALRIVSPPSTGSATPVMKPDAGSARLRMAWASSSGCA